MGKKPALSLKLSDLEDVTIEVDSYFKELMFGSFQRDSEAKKPIKPANPKDIRILIKNDSVIESIIDKLRFLFSPQYSILNEKQLIDFVETSFVKDYHRPFTSKMINVDQQHERLLRAVFFELSHVQGHFITKQPLQENLSELMILSFSCFASIKPPSIKSSFSSITKVWMSDNENSEIGALVRAIRRNRPR